MRLSINSRLFFFVGSVIAIGSNIVNHYLSLNDLLHGFIFGIGAGLMIWGIYLMRRQSK